MIGYGKQYIDEDDIKAVEEVLRSDYLTCGPKVQEFEEKFADYVNSKYAVAVSNGTAALHLLALATKPKHTVVPDITFMATANAFAHTGSQIHIQDVEDTQPMLPPTQFPEDSLIVPVHMAGFPVQIDKYYTRTIEDACHALGAIWKDSKDTWHKVGDCSYSLASVFSFHPVKPITTGEGGMITTNDKALYEKVKQLRSHGIEDNKYTMNYIGLNYRMTDIQAALGISQLMKIDRFTRRRREIAKTYDKYLIGLTAMTPYSWQLPSYHLYTIRVKNRNLVRKALHDKGIGTQIHYKPLHQLEYYNRKTNKMMNIMKYKNANAWYREELSIPIYYGLTDEEVRYIIDTILSYV